MNSFTIILAVVVAVTAVLVQGGGQVESTKALEICKTKVAGVTADEIEEMKKLKAPLTRNGQCFLACFKKQTGLMDANNKMNVENAKRKFTGTKKRAPQVYVKLAKALDECKAQETSEADECEAAKKFANCMYSKRQKAGN